MTHQEWLAKLEATENRHRIRRMGNIARRVRPPAPGLDANARINELEAALDAILLIVAAAKS